MNDLDVGLARSVPVTLPSVKSLGSVAADPISEMRSLDSSLLCPVTGGELRRNLSGAVIKALRSCANSAELEIAFTFLLGDTAKAWRPACRFPYLKVFLTNGLPLMKASAPETGARNI